MKRKRTTGWIAAGLLIALLAGGCAVFSGYGKLRLASEQGDPLTIEALMDNREEYNIAYAGYYSFDPAAILFHPKNSDRAFQADRWIPVEDRRTLSLLVSRMRMNLYRAPHLWRILGPRDRFFGYMYTSWDHVAMKAVDERTLHLYDILFPPQPDDEGPWFSPF
ncbi:MAG: hypothetical protein JW821_20390 [Deltaproteobacteria bacterium]|nr:hypothetical protein [Deltaproteobacteria bacterium]